jgi:hypothetical protein
VRSVVQLLWKTPLPRPGSDGEAAGRERTEEEIEQLNADQQRRIRAWTEPRNAMSQPQSSGPIADGA